MEATRIACLGHDAFSPPRAVGQGSKGHFISLEAPCGVGHVVPMNHGMIGEGCMSGNVRQVSLGQVANLGCPID